MPTAHSKEKAVPKETQNAQQEEGKEKVQKRDKGKKKMSDEEVLSRLRQIVNPENPKDRFRNLKKIGQGLVIHFAEMHS